MLGITLRDLLHRRRQFLIAVIGTALTFALALDLTGMSQGFRTEARATVESLGADAWLVAPGVAGPFTSFSILNVSSVDAVTHAAGVTRADPLVVLPTTVRIGSRPVGVNLLGHVAGGIGEPKVKRGRAAAGSGEIVTNSSLGFRLGQRVTVGNKVFTVVGVVSGKTYFAGVPVAFTTLADAQALAFSGAPLANAVLTKGVPAAPPANLRVMRNDDVRRDLLRPMANPTKTIDNTRLFMWLVAAMIVGAVTYLSVLERLRDFAVLKAVGSNSAALVATVSLQAVMASLLAAALAALLANLLRPAFEIPVVITAGAYVALPIVAVVVGVLASVAALRRAVRVDPALAFAS